MNQIHDLKSFKNLLSDAEDTRVHLKEMDEMIIDFCKYQSSEYERKIADMEDQVETLNIIIRDLKNKSNGRFIGRRKRKYRARHATIAHRIGKVQN